MDDSEGLKTSVEEITADVVETARELELEVGPEDGTELLQSHDKANDWGIASCGFAMKVVSWDGICSWEDAVKIVEMSTKDLEYFINWVDKAAAGFERMDSKFWKKCYWG